MTSYLLILALLLGLAPGFIAHGKGRNFLIWWIYGVVLGPVALLHAIMLRSVRRDPPDGPPRPREREWGSPWPMLLRIAASAAILIVVVAAYRFVMPPDSSGLRPERDVATSTDRTPPGRPASPSAMSGGVVSPAPTNAPAAERPAPAVPAPNVRVTIRREPAAGSAESAKPDPVMPKPNIEQSHGLASAPDKAPVPQPPADATPQKLERTLPQEPAAAPKPDLAPMKDVDTLAARPAPPPDRPETKSRTQKQVSVASRPDAPPPKPAAPEKKTETRAVAARTAPDPKPKLPEKAPLDDVTAIGEMVRAVQQALKERGYDTGPANGLAGRQTVAAIRKFQTDRKMKPTGTIDYALLEALNIVGPRTYTFQPPPGVAPGL